MDAGVPMDYPGQNREDRNDQNQNEQQAREHEGSKAKDLWLKIASFVEEDGEPFHEAWERFNLLLAQMPPHTYHPELKVNSFYSGLSPITQMVVDNACGGTIADKRAVEAYDILGKIAQNSQQRTSHVRRGGRI
ncbi:hypothetical protein Dsin_018569 [Dipteronia sinensis]|uniref:Uncharacterized protein n=1 Tax=Dipteronia sinensis TaxID=43782 RepID=A0AAE0E218_9ROSI|nr:hypothetical protein Dsin_018569 [Dipteronia sinensis]